VRIGSPFQILLDLCGVHEGANKLILGGPMMGISAGTTELVVVKGTSGLLLFRSEETGAYDSCIRCGRCIDHCPMGLLPSELSILCEAEAIEAAREANLLDCMECGVCSFVCPAKRPIVHFIRFGKAEVARLKKKAAWKKD
jgi:electron transport complex protein RnfC